jgi:hypothetical protein
MEHRLSPGAFLWRKPAGRTTRRAKSVSQGANGRRVHAVRGLCRSLQIVKTQRLIFWFSSCIVARVATRVLLRAAERL